MRAITISPLPPKTHSITHPSLHPFYALCEERGVPVVFHVENEAPRKIARSFSENGWEGQTDFHGGGENFTATRALCEDRGAVYLDGKDAIPNDPAYFVDGLHPNDRGHKAMARFLLLQLRALGWIT